MLTLLPHFLNNPNDVLHYSVLCCSDVQLQRSLFQEHIFRLRYVEGHDNLIINRPDEFAPSDENSQPDSNKFLKKRCSSSEIASESGQLLSFYHLIVFKHQSSGRWKFLAIFCRFKLSLRMIISFSSFPRLNAAYIIHLLLLALNRREDRSRKKKSLVLCMFFYGTSS